MSDTTQKLSQLAPLGTSARRCTESYISARFHNPAWQLLAARRAPLVLGCLQTLFEQAYDGIPIDSALQSLSEILTAHAHQDEYDIDRDNTPLQARRELRNWIKRALVVERDDRLYATDALETALRFVEGLDHRIMTTTASRLSVVQREIESLEIGLNPNPASRVNSLRRRIEELEHELGEAEAGNVPILNDSEAMERIREVFNLATGLRADFRRVEDSWRQADRTLRQSIISEQFHRGEIVDRLLDGQDALLDTPEGQVFESFQTQMRQSTDLDRMKERLRIILKHPAVPRALTRKQEQEMRWLVVRLVRESQSVFQARARSERDVKGFLKTGLAAEHHRVGTLLSEILNVALKVDWQRQAIRRQPTPLPPVAIAIAGLPLVERLRFKILGNDDSGELSLTPQSGNLDLIDEDFWAAFDGLDRDALVRDTLALLASSGQPMSVAQLAHLLPPTHDLETFALWLGMARQAGIAVAVDRFEEVELTDDESRRWRFRLPYAGLESDSLTHIDWEL